MTTTLNILLVEDNPADVELVREALDATNLVHVLQVANDFEEAKQHMDSMLLGAPRPDVLLMDLNLPQGSGLELLRLFRTNPDWQSIPVIVSSSNAPRDRDQAARLGAAHYFRKPSDLKEFMELGPIVAKSIAKSA
jgi:CheY-like chemotaxis protein